MSVLRKCVLICLLACPRKYSLLWGQETISDLPALSNDQTLKFHSQTWVNIACRPEVVGDAGSLLGRWHAYALPHLCGGHFLGGKFYSVRYDASACQEFTKYQESYVFFPSLLLKSKINWEQLHNLLAQHTHNLHLSLISASLKTSPMPFFQACGSSDGLRAQRLVLLQTFTPVQFGQLKNEALWKAGNTIQKHTDTGHMMRHVCSQNFCILIRTNNSPTPQTMPPHAKRNFPEYCHITAMSCEKIIKNKKYEQLLFSPQNSYKLVFLLRPGMDGYTCDPGRWESRGQG